MRNVTLWVQAREWVHAAPEDQLAMFVALGALAEPVWGELAPPHAPTLAGVRSWGRDLSARGGEVDPVAMIVAVVAKGLDLDLDPDEAADDLAGLALVIAMESSEYFGNADAVLKRVASPETVARFQQLVLPALRKALNH